MNPQIFNPNPLCRALDCHMVDRVDEGHSGKPYRQCTRCGRVERMEARTDVTSGPVKKPWWAFL